VRPKFHTLLAICGVSMISCSSGQDSGLPEPHPVVVIKTSLGTMEITLEAERAPRTVKNFLKYVNSGFYDDTVFHRALHGIMIQGGGYAIGEQEKKTGRSIKNESDNGLKNRRGAIAMAREDKINSATSQFFINLKNNPGFDHKDKTKKGFGYAVFGEVTSGMEIADKIDSTMTISGNGQHVEVVVYSMKLKTKQ
jgi:cyclophilin family peptidyl-prolyl cis-trans isomerase